MYCFDEICEVHHKHMHAWDLFRSTTCCVFFDDRAKDHRKKHVCWEAPQGHDTLYFSMRLLKSAIKTLKLGTSSREQYNIIVFDLLWRTPIVYHIVCNVPHWRWGSLSAVARSMPKKYLQTPIVSHTPQNVYPSCRGSLNTNPYRFPFNSKDISLMPRIFEPKPLSFYRNPKKNTNLQWIAHLSFSIAFAPIPVATPIVFHNSCSWGLI